MSVTIYNLWQSSLVTHSPMLHPLGAPNLNISVVGWSQFGVHITCATLHVCMLHCNPPMLAL